MSAKLQERRKKLRSGEIECFVEKNPKKRFKNNGYDLIRVDIIRLFEIIEIAYFGALYFVFGLLIGTAVNRIFPARNRNSNPLVVFFEAMAQCSLVALASFYIRKIVLMFPSPFTTIKGYCPYIFTEAVSITIMSVVLLATQSRLIQKFEILGERYGLLGRKDSPFVTF